MVGAGAATEEEEGEQFHGSFLFSAFCFIIVKY